MTRYSKAIIAGLAFLLAALKVVSDGLGDAVVSSQEAVAALVAGVAALLVYAVPNVPPAGEPSRPDMSEQDAGYTLVEVGVFLLLLAVAGLILVRYV